MKIGIHNSIGLINFIKFHILIQCINHHNFIKNKHGHATAHPGHM
jgi:hypothetical protein